MTLIDTFKLRKEVAKNKTTTGYRPEYYLGVESAYDEILKDMGRFGCSECKRKK